jgi:hypothetical protein
MSTPLGIILRKLRRRCHLGEFCFIGKEIDLRHVKLPRIMRSRFLAVILFFAVGIPTGVERARAGEVFRVFQWVDSSGVIHFTDDYYTVPLAIRGTAALVVRDRLVEAPLIEPVTYPSVQEPGVACERCDAESEPRGSRSEINPEYSDNAGTTAELAQGATVIVVSNFANHGRKPCHKAGGCTGRFRPDFNDRRYIHPGVFNGSSPQYVQPKLFRPGRK